MADVVMVGVGMESVARIGVVTIDVVMVGVVMIDVVTVGVVMVGGAMAVEGHQTVFSGAARHSER